MVTQVAQHAGEGFRGNAQLRRNQALALAQRDTQGAVAIVLRVTQQPLSATGLRVLGQPAHRQFGLLAVAHRHVMQQQLRRLGQGFDTAQERLDGLAAQLHTGLGHHVDGTGQAQHGSGAVEPKRPLHHAELVAHLAVFADAQQHAAADQVQHRGELFLANAQHFARCHDLALLGHFWGIVRQHMEGTLQCEFMPGFEAHQIQGAQPRQSPPICSESRKFLSALSMAPQGIP